MVLQNTRIVSYRQDRQNPGGFPLAGSRVIQHPQGKYPCRLYAVLNSWPPTMVGIIQKLKKRIGTIMKSAFIVNPAISTEQIQESIYQKMTQARGISGCLLVTNREIDPAARYGIIWALDSLLEEIDNLIHHTV
jgi:hypothetical protein